MTTYNTDLLIVGAGPAGLFAVFQAGMLGIKTHVVEALETIGGQCSALYPEKPIYDIPAFPKILASELIERLEAQAEPFDPFYHFNQIVESFEILPDGQMLVSTSKQAKIYCKTMIIAAGAGAFGPHRPPLSKIEEFEGKSIFYAIKNKKIFSNKIVAIAGGGDSAIDWAINLSEIASKVKLIHRRDKFRAAPDSIRKMEQLREQGKIELLTPYQLHNLHGENGIISAIDIIDFDNQIKTIEADFLLPFFGLSTSLGPIANWGLNLNKTHIEVNPATMESSISGIYAIGDVVSYPNKLKLILSSFSEAAFACHSMYKIIFPNSMFHFEHSTSKGADIIKS